MRQVEFRPLMQMNSYPSNSLIPLIRVRECTVQLGNPYVNP
jgi:hypothetical protein